MTLEGLQVRERRVHAVRGRHHTNAIGSNDAQQSRLRCVKHALLKRSPVLVSELLEARADNDGALRASLAELANQLRDGPGWRTDHSEVRATRQACNVGIAGDTTDH